MPKLDLTARAFPRPEWNDIGIWLGHEHPVSGDRSRGRVELQPLRPEVDDGPSFTVTRELAQLLANSLWDCGIRPVQAAGSIGQVEAMRDHVQDLRDISTRALDLVSATVKSGNAS